MFSDGFKLSQNEIAENFPNILRGCKLSLNLFSGGNYNHWKKNCKKMAADGSFSDSL